MRAKVKVPAKSNKIWTDFLGTALQLYTYFAECVLLTVIQFRNSETSSFQCVFWPQKLCSSGQLD